MANPLWCLVVSTGESRLPDFLVSDFRVVVVGLEILAIAQYSLGVIGISFHQVGPARAQFFQIPRGDGLSDEFAARNHAVEIPSVGGGRSQHNIVPGLRRETIARRMTGVAVVGNGLLLPIKSCSAFTVEQSPGGERLSAQARPARVRSATAKLRRNGKTIPS